MQYNAPSENQRNNYHPKVRKNSKRSSFLKRIKNKLHRKKFRTFECYMILPGRDKVNSCVYRFVRCVARIIFRSFSGEN